MVGTISVIADSNTFFNSCLVSRVEETNYENMMHWLISSWLIHPDDRLLAFSLFHV